MTTKIAPGVGANLLGQHAPERNQDATAYVGNLDPQVFFFPLFLLSESANSPSKPFVQGFPVLLISFLSYPFTVFCVPCQVSEELLWQLFVQAGPVGEFVHFFFLMNSQGFLKILLKLFLFPSYSWLDYFLKQTVPTSCFVVNVYVPKDRVTNLHQGYGFIEFRSEEDADYVCYVVDSFAFLSSQLYAFGSYLDFPFSMILQAIKVLNMIKLYGKPIRVNKVYT